MNSARGNGFEAVIALILLIIGLVIGFYVGSYYESGQNIGATATSTTTTVVTQPVTGTPAYYQDVSEWQTDTESGAGFSLAYPLDFPVQPSGNTAPSTDWSLAANGNTGNLVLTLTVPKAFEPQTNFSDAKLTVGESTNTKAISSCLTAAPNESKAPATVTFNGVQFAVFTTTDAGAGNLYDSTSYRAVHGGKCYAVEYTIHSTQLANYPAEYGLTQFDKTKLTDVLDRIAGTVKLI